MNASDRQAIRERADAATPGPWGFGGRGVASMNETEPDPLIAETDFTPRDIRDFPAGFNMLAEMRRARRNGEFIAHARTDVPALLAALDEAQEDRDEEHTTVEVLRGELKEAEREVARLTAVVERAKELCRIQTRKVSLAEIRAALDPAPLHGGITADLPGQTP